jgi:hypothetical protein
MRRTFALLVAALLLLAIAVPAASAGKSSTWHRSNYGTAHERLICTGSSGVWHCRYDTLPNYPEQGDRSNTIGEFNGSSTAADQANAWCPEWAADVCDHAQQFVVGAQTWIAPDGATIWEELILTNGQDGLAPMYMYLVGPLLEAICPWYPTWDEVLANDPQCFLPD